MSEEIVSGNIIEGVYASVNNEYKIVEQTETFSDIEKSMGMLANYNINDKLKKRLNGQGERFILKPISDQKKNEYLTFSRLSGSSNSGRVTIIAHHLAIKLKDLENGKMDAGDLVEWTGGLESYDSKFEFTKIANDSIGYLLPKKLCKDSRGSLPSAKLLEKIEIKSNQQLLLKDAMAGVANRLFGLEENKKKAILIIPDDWQKYVPRLLAIILYLLPNGIQNSLVAVSQVWDEGDLNNFDADLVFTHLDAPYLATMQSGQKKNSLEIFDLTNLELASGAVLSEITNKNYKQYALEYWDAKNSKTEYCLQNIFNDLDPKCLRKNDVLALKCCIEDFFVEDTSGKLTISEKLENLIKKLKGFYDCDSECGNPTIINYLAEFVNHAVNKVESYGNIQEKCDALLQIWKHIEIIIGMKPVEIKKVLESNYRAISNNYEDILKCSASAFAKACISTNRNHEIVKIIEYKQANLRELLSAIEIELFHCLKTHQNASLLLDYESCLLDIVSSWFSLGMRIITPAYDRIKDRLKLDCREKDMQCYFSSAIMDKHMVKGVYYEVTATPKTKNVVD